MCGQGFGLAFAVAVAGEALLGWVCRLRPGASRRQQYRQLMIVNLGRLGVDMAALLAVFFLFSHPGALVGGALGLLCWRGLEVGYRWRRLSRPGKEVAGSL